MLNSVTNSLHSLVERFVGVRERIAGKEANPGYRNPAMLPCGIDQVDRATTDATRVRSGKMK